MPTPDKPSLDYSYTAFSEGQGDNSFPGTQLDNDFANLKQSIDETIDFVGQVIRDDGSLQNGIVTKSTLAADVLTGVAAPRPWATATVYAIDQTVTTDNALYLCLVAHTSGDFATDYANGLWYQLAVWTPLSSVTDGSITEPKHATGGVSTRALADASVTTEKHADGSVTRAKLGADVSDALMPIGAMVPFAGPIPPAKWLFAFGQTVSRTTYAALFGAITASISGNIASGSPTVTSVSVDLRNLGLEGSQIEGPGIPAGATLVSCTASTLTLSTNATANNSSGSMRVFPHGNGDGTTTFTLPDRRGRVSAGRDNMGGTQANRLTSGLSGVAGVKLGSVGGDERLQSHAHSKGIPPANQIQVPNTGPTVYVLQGDGLTYTSDTGTAGSGNSQNVQPVGVDNHIIFAGA